MLIYVLNKLVNFEVVRKEIFGFEKIFLYSKLVKNKGKHSFKFFFFGEIFSSDFVLNFSLFGFLNLLEKNYQSFLP